MICKFFLDSRSDINLFRSDLVTRLRTPASSTTYVSVGGPSFRTSNSDASAGSTGQKLIARERAAAARACWRHEMKLFWDGIGEESVGFFKEEEMGSDFGWRGFERWGLGRPRRGVKEEGEEMIVSIFGKKLRW